VENYNKLNTAIKNLKCSKNKEEETMKQKAMYAALFAAVAAMGASAPVMAAENVQIESTIFGTADTEGFSTLKAYTDAELTVEGQKVTYTGEAVLDLGADADIDISEAYVSLDAGDGYYLDDFIFNGGSNLTVQDGKVVYTLNTGDIEWNNYGYEVGEGGNEWSCIGGNGNGEYVFNLSMHGVKVNGEELDAVPFRANVYIYGREFSSQSSPSNPNGSTWGAGGYDDVVLPEAVGAELTEDVAVGEEPVWTWVGSDDYDLPVFCDYETDNFYISWPEGVDAASLTDEDVTITLYSQYGDAYVLTANTGETTFEQNGLSIPNGEYSVFASETTTQVAINMVYWPMAPVYNTMTIEVNADKVDGYEGEVSQDYDIATVYANMVQAGGGLDLENTVTTVNVYGIGNIEDLSIDDVYTPVTYYYVYSEGEGRQAQELYYLVDNGDGTFTVTDNKDEATVYDSEETNAQLLGHNIFTTNNSGTVEEEYEGTTYTFKRKLNYGNAAASNLLVSDSMEAAPGYVMTAKGSYDDHQRSAWLYFNNTGWKQETTEEAE
jgi:hypothetical protein